MKAISEESTSWYLAVGDGSLDANHREAGEDAGFHGFLHASIDGRNEFLGDVAAGDLVDELVALAVLGVERLEASSSTCDRTGREPPGLLLVRVFVRSSTVLRIVSR